jgi:hypothetical protein
VVGRATRTPCCAAWAPARTGHARGGGLIDGVVTGVATIDEQIGGAHAGARFDLFEHAGGLALAPAHNAGWVADPVRGAGPLAAHGPDRFRPARRSQVWAGGNATSGAPADEYGST